MKGKERIHTHGWKFTCTYRDTRTFEKFESFISTRSYLPVCFEAAGKNLKSASPSRAPSEISLAQEQIAERARTTPVARTNSCDVVERQGLNREKILSTYLHFGSLLPPISNVLPWNSFLKFVRVLWTQLKISRISYHQCLSINPFIGRLKEIIVYFIS